MISDQEAVQAVLRARNDPAWWCREVLGDEPWSFQSKILESVRDNAETAVRACHGVGKDWIAARAVGWFLTSFPPCIVLTTGPTARQVQGILWKEIRLMRQQSKYNLGGRITLQKWTFGDDQWAWGFTAPEYDPDRFVGWHELNILVVIDEAAGVGEHIYTAIDSVLSSENSKKLEIGNPTDKETPFGTSFDTEGVSKLKMDAFNTPNFTEFGITIEDIRNDTWAEKITGPLPNPKLITPAWVRKRWLRWCSGAKEGEKSARWKSRVMGEFPVGGTECVIEPEWIDAAIERTLEPSSPSVISVDIGREGPDPSVIGWRRGPVYREYDRLDRGSTMITTGKAVRAMNKTKADRAHVETVGVGSGVYDRMEEQGYNVRDASPGSTAREPEDNANQRSEWMWNIRERFERGEIDIDPNDSALIKQLRHLRGTIKSDGKFHAEAKDTMKARIKQSPDEYDALAIAYANLEERELYFA